MAGSSSIKLQFTPVSLGMMAVASTLPGIVIVFFVSMHLNSAEDMHPFIRQDVLALGMLLLIASAILGLLVILAGFFLKKSSPESRPYVITCTQYVAINYALWGIFMGPYTTPVSLLVIGVLLTGFLLFDKRVVLYAVGTTVALLAGFELMMLGESVHYAPVFLQAPVDNGAFLSKWLVLLRVMFFLAFFVLLGIFVLVYWRLNIYEDELQKLSTIDSLTGLANRRYFMEKFDQEYHRNKRTYRSLSICMIDADHFKKINDQYGHIAGDRVLKAISSVFLEQVRAGVDVAGRLGGEEFAVLLPETGLGEATAVAERILDAIRGLEFEEDGSRFSVTVSIGLVSAESGNHTPDNLLAEADRNLYQAKSKGRDRLVSTVV